MLTGASGRRVRAACGMEGCPIPQCVAAATSGGEAVAAYERGYMHAHVASEHMGRLRVLVAKRPYASRLSVCRGGRNRSPAGLGSPKSTGADGHYGVSRTHRPPL